MEFWLNGSKINYQGDPETKLLKWLREEVGIISAKDGCSGQASCGCCSVLIDGKATLSCTTPMKKIEGARIETTEGFEKKIQDAFSHAFVEKGGVQCGFCTPGIVVQAKALIDKNKNPSRAEIKKALTGNICRCTGWKKVVDSIEYATKILNGEEEIKPRKTSGKVGERLQKYDSLNRVLGWEDFVADMKFDDMVYAALKFSDHPRARVLKIHTKKAQALEGVLGVYTAKDIPGERMIGLIYQDWPFMVKEGEITNYIGDVLAQVAAVSEKIAREAVSLIEVEYEVFEPVCDVHEALKKDSDLVHAYKGTNILGVCEVKRGDIQKALEESDFIAKATFQTQCIEHAFLECECAIAKPWKNSDSIEVYSQGQGVYEDRKQIAKILGIPLENVNVHQVSNGGGFGGKEDLTVQGHAAHLAWKLKRPVKVLLTRDESMCMHPKRHPIYMEYELGCSKSGKLTAIRANIIGDTGCYASVGTKVLERAVGHATSAYTVPVAHLMGTTVYTNNIPNGAMRGFGANQATFAMESLVDELCRQGGFDRWQFRYDNAIRNGDRTSTGQLIESGAGVLECLLALKEDYDQAILAKKAVGLATGIKNCGVGNGMNDEGHARITIHAPDHIEINHGWTEMGQGVHTMALHTFCEETGIDPEYVRVHVKTENNLPTGMTTSSRATSLVGHSVIKACENLKKDLQTKKLSDLVGNIYEGKWVCDWTTKPGTEKEGQEPVTHYSYSYAAQMVILDANGKIDKVIACHDAGKIMNPTLFEGQIEGAVHMGIGYAVTEEFVQERSRPKTTKLGRMGILRASQTPEVIVRGVEVPDPHGPFGAKGVGEIGLVPTAGAVANALTAFDGVMRTTLPLKEKKLI